MVGYDLGLAAGKVKEFVDGSGEGGVKVGWMNVAGAIKLKTAQAVFCY